MSAEGEQPDEERVRALVQASLEEVDAFLERKDVRAVFDEIGADPRLWERSRRDLASVLEERGVSIPDGVELTARESEGQDPAAVEEEASKAGIDIALLGSIVKRAGGTAMAQGATLVAVESSGPKKLVYACQPVEVCRQVSDPNVWGGKILWGCRTVCVGTGWRVV